MRRSKGIHRMWKPNKLLLFLFIIIMSLALLSCGRNIGNNPRISDNNEAEPSSTKTETDEHATDNEYDERIKELIRMANEGDIDAQNRLAYYYFNGYGVEKDYNKSLEWSIKSAEAGNLASMFNVGYNYYHGFTGEKDYELAFEWYKKAADRMFPKALNAIGHMYYEGLGVEKDIDRAIEYTLQSAGYLHNYSFSNMGALIDEQELEGDANYWYRLSAKNYMIQSGSNSILYDNLINEDIDIEVEYLTESENVPKELIEVVLYKFYSGTLYEYLETSSVPFKNFDINELNMDEQTRQKVSPSWWYDSNYLVDINKDGIEELISFRLEGTMGISSFQVLTNVNGEYVLEEESSSADLMHGINGIITHNDKKYFIVANVDIGNRSILGVSIYSFDDLALSDSILIRVIEEDTHVTKTYQLSEEYDAFIEVVEKRIDKMFVEKYNSLLYEKVNESMILDIDIDNDGDLEHYEYEAIFYGTINNPLSLDFKEGLTSEKDLKTIEKVIRFNDLSLPIGLETFSVGEINYLGVLSYELGTNNHCFTTFKLENNQVTVISNHLISYNEKFIISNNSSFF